MKNTEHSQPFEDREELMNLIRHAASNWKTDSNWSPLLYEINLVCSELAKLEVRNKELVEACEMVCEVWNEDGDNGTIQMNTPIAWYRPIRLAEQALKNNEK